MVSLLSQGLWGLGSALGPGVLLTSEGGVAEQEEGPESCGRDTEGAMWPEPYRSMLGATSLLGITGRMDGAGREQMAGGTLGGWPRRVMLSLAIVFPLLDDFIELVAWRQSVLHIPVSFDFIVGSQEALSHPTFQKIQGGTDSPLWGYPICKGRGTRHRKLDWASFEEQGGEGLVNCASVSSLMERKTRHLPIGLWERT